MAMITTTPANYWISKSALSITLNALGNPDYAQCSVVQGANILVWVKNFIDFDAGHNYRRWPLVSSPTAFDTSTTKYVYARIPREETSENQNAMIVFPSEIIGLDGKNAAGDQIGPDGFWYINLQGIITPSVINGGIVQRQFEKPVETGSLSTDEALQSIPESSPWYSYNKVSNLITFLVDLELLEGKKFYRLVADSLTATGGYIASLSANTLSATIGNISSLVTDALTSANASITNLLTAHDISAHHAQISSVEANDVSAGTANVSTRLDAAYANIPALDSETVTTDVADVLNLILRQWMSSPQFVDGIAGEGFRLWLDANGLSNLTLDKLTVRQVMTVFELLIAKIRAVGGQLVVSASNGKIKTVEELGYQYRITFEQDNSFESHDLLRCQVFTGDTLKSYWAEVAAVDGNSILIDKSEFGDTGIPEVADECVLMGNTVNTSRQNFILISATEDGQPRIDVMNGVSTKSFAGSLRTRLGNLDGIIDTLFPVDGQPHGDGLYSDNAYLRGTFLLSTGEDIKTKFEITEGKLESTMSALRQDFATDRGYLNNPSFDEGLKKWRTELDAIFWQVNNKWIWANNNVLTTLGDGARVLKDNGRTVVRIKNKYILQKNENLRALPEIEEPEQGELKKPVPVFLSFLYRCATSGTLHVEFVNVDTSGFESFTSMDVQDTLAVTSGYQQYTCNGLWNGTGDFKLSFTGDIFLYMLILSTDKLEAFTNRYSTLFEQSDQLVAIAANNFDEQGNVLSKSGIMVKANQTGIYAQGADGNVAIIGAGVSETTTDPDTGETISRTVVKLGADNIMLEGLVTANEHFKIDEYGNMEAVNGKFSGNVTAETSEITTETVTKEIDGIEEQVDVSVSYTKSAKMNVKDEDNRSMTGLWIKSTRQEEGEEEEELGAAEIYTNGDNTFLYTRGKYAFEYQSTYHGVGESCLMSSGFDSFNFIENGDGFAVSIGGKTEGIYVCDGLPQATYKGHLKNYPNGAIMGLGTHHVHITASGIQTNSWALDDNGFTKKSQTPQGPSSSPCPTGYVQITVGSVTKYLIFTGGLLTRVSTTPTGTSLI